MFGMGNKLGSKLGIDKLDTQGISDILDKLDILGRLDIVLDMYTLILHMAEHMGEVQRMDLLCIVRLLKVPRRRYC